MGIYSTFDLQFISEPSIYIGICHFLNLSAYRFYKNIYIKRERRGSMDVCVQRIPKRCIYLSRSIKISSILCICIWSSLFANVCALKWNGLLVIFNSLQCSHELEVIAISGLVTSWIALLEFPKREEYMEILEV